MHTTAPFSNSKEAAAVICNLTANSRGLNPIPLFSLRKSKCVDRITSCNKSKLQFATEAKSLRLTVTILPEARLSLMACALSLNAPISTCCTRDQVFVSVVDSESTMLK